VRRHHRRFPLAAAAGARGRCPRQLPVLGALDRRVLPPLLRGARAAPGARGLPRQSARGRARRFPAVQALSPGTRRRWRNRPLRLRPRPAGPGAGRPRRARHPRDPAGRRRALAGHGPAPAPAARAAATRGPSGSLASARAGGDRAAGLALDPRGTPFQRRVWEALRAIPAGAAAWGDAWVDWGGGGPSPRPALRRGEGERRGVRRAVRRRGARTRADGRRARRRRPCSASRPS